jgi:hypothetical protein
VPWDTDWDDVVDVVCTDAGIAGLCGAIASVDADADVFLAAPTERRTGWFPAIAGSGGHALDADTAAYLTSLTDDIDLGRITQLDADLPGRTLVPPGPPGGPVPPFFGARLRSWAIRTIGSPSGFLYTRLTDWRTTTLVADDGEHLEVAEVGPMPEGGADPVRAVYEGLIDEANERRIRTREVTRCEALVILDGMVAGAVFATDDGPWAVRAEHGVLVCGPPPAGGTVGPCDGAGRPRVAMVTKAGSRFGRVELLTRGPASAAGGR